MAIVFTNDEHYGDIADAIRLKNGTQTTYRPDEMAAAIEAIPGGLTPTGTIQITQNGNYNVTNYAEANVAVPGITPAGVKSITADGTYDVSTFATANVNTKPAKGLVFGDYDSDGYPHSAEFVGSWTEIPTQYFRVRSGCFMKNVISIIIPEGVTVLRDYSMSGLFQQVSLPASLSTMGGYSFYGASGLISISIPAEVTTIGQQSFRECASLKTVVFLGNVPDIQNVTYLNAPVELYDFSNATSVPSLYSINSLGHANGCVIKVPQSLLSEWQNTTNWVGLTDVVWQGV